MSEKHYLQAELEHLIQSDPSIWDFIRGASLDGVWYWDLENPEHEWISAEFWRTFGIDPATKQHLASEWMEMIFPEDLELAKENLAKHLSNPDHPYDQVVRYKAAGDRVVHVRCRGLAIRNGRGEATRLFGAHNDITPEVERAQLAHRSSGLLGLIMDTARSGIIGLNRAGDVVSVNPAGRHMLGGISILAPFGWPEEIAFVDNEDMHPLDASQDPVQRALAGASLSGEISIMTRRGSQEFRYVRVSSAPVERSEDEVHTVLIIDDVSEQEKHRQQVERKSRLDALGQLTGGIAHDFNNLLATIQYALQLAHDMPDPDRQRTYLSTALRSVTRGTELTKRLLAFAKRQPGLSRSQNVADVIEDFRKLAGPVIEEAITVDFIVEDRDLWVFCDTAQLENALLNLLLNSRDAIMRSAKGSQVTVAVRGVPELDADVTLRREHANTYIAKGLYHEHKLERSRKGDRAFRYIEIAVTDDGPGMSEEIKRRAVDPFFTTKDSSSGSGLGLSMVYGFVQQSNGELRIYSEEDTGTTVRLLLPRGTPDGGREEPVQRLPLTQGAGERVMIVEDELSLMLMMNDLITSLGYEVIAARSAREALRHLEEDEPVNLVITDIVMPGGMGGFELASEIRARRPDLPLIYMSGYTGFSPDEMNDVVAPMIQKPCPPAELAAAISHALQGKT